jgi:sugar lactone lactonase YvrE
MRIRFFTAIVALECVAAWCGCSNSESGSPTAPTCQDCCDDGFPRGSSGSELQQIAPFTPSPEGVAVCPDGTAYVLLDASAEIWRVPFDGKTPERWTSIGGRQAAGLACDEHGRLFVSIFAVRDEPSAVITVVLVDRQDRSLSELPLPGDGTPLTGLNGILAIPGLGVYVTDTLGQLVLRIQETAPETFETTVVARDVNGANGLAYDFANRKLYVAASLVPAVFAFSTNSDGSLGTRATVPVASSLTFPDGLAVDEMGSLYVADYFAGTVLRAADGAAIARLTNPASLAFRGGTLLITDYRIGAPTTPGGLYAVNLGVCGSAQ